MSTGRFISGNAAGPVLTGRRECVIMPVDITTEGENEAQSVE